MIPSPKTETGKTTNILQVDIAGTRKHSLDEHAQKTMHRTAQTNMYCTYPNTRTQKKHQSKMPLLL